MRTAKDSTSQFVAALVMGICLSGCSTGAFSVQEIGGLEKGSPEWWAQQANNPPGVRSKCKKGKVWPARHRPTGERQQFTHGYHSAHYWPLPYVCQDRAYMKEIIGNQNLNGWHQATTLGRHFFNEEHQLNSPGEAKLLTILDTTPVAYRTVYVEATRQPEIDNIRLSNIQQRVMELTQGQESVRVELRKGRSYLQSADEIKIINQLYKNSIPSPRLSTSPSGGGGGASGGGAGGGGAGVGGGAGAVSAGISTGGP